MLVCGGSIRYWSRFFVEKSQAAGIFAEMAQAAGISVRNGQIFTGPPSKEGFKGKSDQRTKCHFETFLKLKFLNEISIDNKPLLAFLLISFKKSII